MDKFTPNPFASLAQELDTEIVESNGRYRILDCAKQVMFELAKIPWHENPNLSGLYPDSKNLQECLISCRNILANHNI